MGHAQIPQRADEIDREYGIDANGKRIDAVVFQHTRRGHDAPMFWIMQCRRTEDGRIERGSRMTRQYAGKDAEQRMRNDFSEVRELLVATR